MKGLLYTLLIGAPFCVLMFTIGILLICTVVLAPVGMTCIALGVKCLTLSPRPKVVRVR